MKFKRGILIFLFIVLNGITALCKEVYQQQEIVHAAWGTGPGQFGLQAGPERETVGPLTFTLDPAGNIYLYDFINQRFQKFGNDGTYLQTIGSGLNGSSCCVDDLGNIYLLDVAHHLVRGYSPTGELFREIKIADAIDLIEGYAQNLTIDAEKNLVVNRVDQQVYPLENLGLRNSDFGILNPQSSIRNQKSELGYLGKVDKNRYRMQWRNIHQTDILVTDAANNLGNTVTMTTPDEFGAVLFLGQDTAGNIYTEIERTDTIPHSNAGIISGETSGDSSVINQRLIAGLHLEVWKYNREKELVTVLEVPNDYYSTVYKKLEVDDAGNIFQMYITQKGVRIIKYYR
jgi:hypothetical protein